MKYFSRGKKSFGATPLIVAMILILFPLAPQKTYATDPIGGPANAADFPYDVATASYEALVSAGVQALVIKDYVLDGLTPILKDALIRSMTSSILNWINSGFQGDPAFVTDLQRELENIALSEADRYVNKLVNLVPGDPINISIAKNIALSYTQSPDDALRSTMGDTLVNPAAFSNDFSQGGWAGWFAMLEPQNNFYGRSYIANDQLNGKIANQQSVAKQELNWGDGFLSFKKCTDSAGGVENTGSSTWKNPDTGELETVNKATSPKTTGGNDTWKNPDTGESEAVHRGNATCTIETPGSVIQTQLNEILPAGLRNLEVADEINEIIQSLLTNLLDNILGNGSLAGTSLPSASTPAITDLLLQDTIPDSSDVTGSVATQISVQKNAELKYQNTKETSLSAVNEAEAKLIKLESCYQEKADSGITWHRISTDDTDTTNNLDAPEYLTPADAQTKADEARATINSTLRPYNDPVTGSLTADIRNAEFNIGQLDEFMVGFSSVQNTTELETLIGDYFTFSSSGELHNTQDLLDAQLERDGYPGTEHGFSLGIVRDMEALNAETDIELALCESYSLR